VNIYAPKKPKRINSVSVTLALMTLAFGYFLWAFIPIYWPIFQLKGIIRAACNDAYRVLDDEAVVSKLVQDAARTGLPLTKDNFRMERVQMEPEEIEAETADFEDQVQKRLRQDYLRQRGKTCKIEYYYRGRYDLPLIAQTVQITWNDTVSGSLETVSW